MSKLYARRVVAIVALLSALGTEGCVAIGLTLLGVGAGVATGSGVSYTLDSIAYLPDRVGYLWLKARSGEAIKVETRRLALPAPERLRQVVEGLQQDSRVGGRVTRTEYEKLIQERDQEWLLGSSKSLDLERQMEETYRHLEDQE